MTNAKPLNALIAEALGWRTWEDVRPGRDGEWFQERDHPTRPGMIEVRPVINYIRILRDDVRMHQGAEKQEALLCANASAPSIRPCD